MGLSVLTVQAASDRLKNVSANRPDMFIAAVCENFMGTLIASKHVL